MERIKYLINPLLCPFTLTYFLSIFYFAAQAEVSNANTVESINLTITHVTYNGINTVIVPFELIDGLIVIKAKINNEEEGNFIIDTGADGLVLNDKYYTGKEQSSDVAVGLNGENMNLKRSSLDQVLIDELQFSNVQADIIDLQSIEKSKKVKINGLIGYRILQEFEIMFHYYKRYITLSRTDQNGYVLDVMEHTKNKVDSFPLQIAHYAPLLIVNINKIEKKMILDTGSEFNLLNIKGNDDVIDNFVPNKRIMITGAEGKEQDVIGGKLYRLSVGSKYKCGALSSVFINLKYLNKIYKTEIDGVLGFEFLSPWVMSLNYKKKLLYIHALKFERP